MSAGQKPRLFEGAERVSTSLEIDVADGVIGAHDGDPRRAVRELMADAGILNHPVSAAGQLIGHGHGRGWHLTYECHQR